MKNLPNIFKPRINKQLNNNSKVYYSNNNDVLDRNTTNTKKNIKKVILNNPDSTKKVMIVTKNESFTAKIVDRMGNNIITDTGKIISTIDILAIYEN